MSPASAMVERPEAPGAPQRAIVNATGAWVNLRAGPGKQYRLIGEIEDKTVLRYYPATLTENDWVWVEQSWRAGWVASPVVDFEPVEEGPRQPDLPGTPYDGRVAIWHWKGDVLPYNSIDELAQELKRHAPQVTEVFVKISDATGQLGANWQGRWDNNPELALTGPERIDRWVSALGRYGMNFHAWSVARGLDTAAETNLIVQACRRPGVRSLILDVEPYAGFWSGGREGIRPFMMRIRRQLPAGFHIGMSVDPRRHHYRGIWPGEWRPFVNSVHPQVYWATFGNLPEEALQEAWEVWGDYGLPIVPVLQGDAEAREIRSAHTLATQRHGAPGVAWWRLGVIGQGQFQALNQPVTAPAGEPDPLAAGHGRLELVRPEDAGFARGAYAGDEQFGSFRGAMGWPVWYRPTQAARSLTWAHWAPTLRRPGAYELAVFVPDEHADTQNASYRIHGVRGAGSLVAVNVDQERYSNQWVTLGVYSFEAGESGAGSVFVTDRTGEDDREIAFDAIRWRELPGNAAGPGEGPDLLADGYDAPVGTVIERRSPRLWPGSWRAGDAFGQLALRPGREEGYLPGVNLEMSDPSARRAVFACAGGVVTFSGTISGQGETIIIRHDPLAGSGRVLTSRYMQVENVQVQTGQRVRRGEQIASAAEAAGGGDCRLGLDLCATSALERQPGHWPGRNYLSLMRNYVDPHDFIGGHRPGEATLSG